MAFDIGAAPRWLLSCITGAAREFLGAALFLGRLPLLQLVETCLLDGGPIHRVVA